MKKAYKIHCQDNDHGQVVVFAEGAKEAIQMDNRELCDCTYVDKGVRRAKDFDDVEGGRVTIQDYLDRDWYLRCSECDEQVHKDDTPLIAKTHVFCSDECAMRVVERYTEAGVAQYHESIADFYIQALSVAMREEAADVGDVTG